MAVGAALVALAGATTMRAQGATTNDGVYTEEQAIDGKALFAEACSTCHSPGKFSGGEFKAAYVNRPLSLLSGAMAEMPLDAPGSLKPEHVAALIAYFLQMNEYPSGAAALSGEDEALKAIMVAPRP